jgi:hypothetical protein
MASQQISPKGKRRNGFEGLYARDAGILYGPGIASGGLPFLHRKLGRAVIYMGP